MSAHECGTHVGAGFMPARAPIGAGSTPKPDDSWTIVWPCWHKAGGYMQFSNCAISLIGTRPQKNGTSRTTKEYSLRGETRGFVTSRHPLRPNAALEGPRLYGDGDLNPDGRHRGEHRNFQHCSL